MKSHYLLSFISLFFLGQSQQLTIKLAFLFSLSSFKQNNLVTSGFFYVDIVTISCGWRWLNNIFYGLELIGRTSNEIVSMIGSTQMTRISALK